MTTTNEVVMTEVQQQQPSALSSETKRLTFPCDFPSPKGFAIIPFREFEERGIRLEPGPDDAEVDTLGIPTVTMLHRHDTDVCKTKTKRQKMKEMVAKKAEAGIAQTWWEQWEDRESIRLAKTGNSSDSRLLKFVQAADDFKTGRKWPVGLSQTDPLYLWNQVELFLGLGGGVPPSKRTSAKAFLNRPVGQGAISDDDMDTDDDDNTSLGKGGGLVNESVKDKKTVAFLNDPEKSVKIFMSSHARAKGIIWSHSNLENMPRLWRFFLQFLLRSRILPYSELAFRNALEVVEIAMKELPLTSKIAKEVPDGFSKGCKEYWGAKAEGYETVKLDDDFLASLQTTIPNTNEEPSGNGWESSNGWNSINDSSTEWGGSNDDANNPWSSTIIETESKSDDDASSPWTMPKQNSLLPLLGCTALPLTHTPGIVESSLRRIKSIITPPSSSQTKPSASGENDGLAGPNAAAVENELEQCFVRVVMSPWLNWDGGQLPVYSNPAILPTSQGPVVEPPYVKRDEATPAISPDPGPKPHDPAADDITLLVEPSVAGSLSVGTALAGTWVQLSRQPTSGERPAKKRKKGKKNATPNYWYLDEVAVVIPSFWAVGNA